MDNTKDNEFNATDHKAHTTKLLVLFIGFIGFIILLLVLFLVGIFGHGREMAAGRQNQQITKNKVLLFTMFYLLVHQEIDGRRDGRGPEPINKPINKPINNQ